MKNKKSPVCYSFFPNCSKAQVLKGVFASGRCAGGGGGVRAAGGGGVTLNIALYCKNV